MKTDLRVFAETEIRLIVYAFFFGIAAAAVYDAFRILRTFLGCGLAAEKKYTQCELPLIGCQKPRRETRLGRRMSVILLNSVDLIYMLILAVAITVFYYSFADGIVRWYTLLGAVAGFYIYMKTVGAATKKAVGAILFILTTACRYIWYFGIKPFILLRKIYKKTFGRAYASLLMKRSDALTRKYIETTLTRKLDEIGSIVSGLDTGAV